ncbi:MAG TPA: AtpZ/AtpI family protein [Bacteroidales bacterium]|nr:AtpZ/AtpI family protein [Bacteroidales bacterium]
MEDQSAPKDLKSQEKKPESNGLKNFAHYSGIGIQMGVIIFITVWGGTKLDHLLVLKTPVFTIILSLLGVATAIYTAIKDFIR